MRDALTKRTGTFGVAVRGVGLKDIILPGDMKTLLNQVIAAQKEAEANLIKRREGNGGPPAARPTRPSCWRKIRISRG